ncbi:hypothetical protein ACHAXR_009635 [Thalassiosira sp. AJA248-18]
MAYATAHHPLVMVEVVPLIMTEPGAKNNDGRKKYTSRNCPPPISTPSAKIQLLNMSRQGMLSKGWLGTEATEDPYSKQKRGNESNKPEVIDIETESISDANSTAQHRGLWLKSDDMQRGSKCKICQNEGDRRITSMRESNHNFDKAIISGDLAFRGKDADAGTISELVEHKCNSSVSVTYLRSDNPVDECGVPCHLRGYVFANTATLPVHGCCICQMKHFHCAITSGTIVQIQQSEEILPSIGDMQILDPKGDSLLAKLSGRSNIAHDMIQDHYRQPHNAAVMDGESKLSCYDKETVDSLSLRMSTMLANPVWIGTTPHALSVRKLQQQDSETIEEELDTFWNSHSNQKTANNVVTSPAAIPSDQENRSNSVPLLLREGALLVHNSHPNSGKSTLVTTIAKNILKCNAVHVISAPALFAKYGTNADAALESTLHELALRCAVRGSASVSRTCAGDNLDNKKKQQYSGEVARVCIILDHLETFLPLSRQAGGDPYLPVLNAIVAYLNRLSFAIKARNELPFPPNNPLYNICEHGGSPSGFTLPLGICLVGVTTCLEGKGKGSTFQSAIDAIGGGRFRVPLPSAATRLSALRHFFEVCGVKLSEDAKEELPELAATITWASGGAFMDIARKLVGSRSKMEKDGSSLASAQDLKRAMTPGPGQPDAETTSFTADFPSLSTTHGSTKAKAVTFSSVGGNVDAKLALEDALALDPAKRHLLSKFGLQTPTGVLLYGPPGTGKTLLARAVAQMLQRKDDMGAGNAGGSFVALKASDIVRPEVGNSEKLIVSAFETARLNAPSVIFIDEFQALFGDREGGSFILGQMASTLLQCMDDITRWSEIDPSIDDAPTPPTQLNGRIVVLGATNTPWMIDKAFLRPGRFDRAVHVGLPGVEDSEEILRVHASKMKLATLKGGLSSVDEICKSMSKLCLGFSGADLAGLCRAAAVRCLSSGGGSSGITTQHFLDAFMHDVRRSSNDALVKRITAWQP